MAINYYKILGVSENATSEEIDSAYVLLSAKFDVKKNLHSTFLREMSDQLLDAYNVLKDYDKRIEFDFTFLGKERPKEKVVPMIEYFICSKGEFENNEEILFSWNVVNADIVRIEPFGVLLENGGERKFKILNEEVGESIVIKLIAINSDSETIIEQEIELLEIRYNNNSEIKEIEGDIRREEESYSSKGNRLGRTSFLVKTIVYTLFLVILSVILESKKLSLGTIVFGLVYLLILCNLIKKRLHDINLSGWMILLLFIPVVNIIMGLIIVFFPGKDGINKYGIR